MKPTSGMSHTESGSSESALRLRRSPRLLGKSAMSIPISSPKKPRKSRKSPAKEEGESAIMTIPESSSPDEGKSAMTMPEHSRMKIYKPSHIYTKGCGVTFCGKRSGPPGGISTIMRLNREHNAEHFRRNYAYRDDLRERKTCIHSGEDFSWEGESSGFTWVAVQGRRIACVVFKRNWEYVKDRLRSYLVDNPPEITFNLFGLTVISDIEVLADLPTEKSPNFESCGQKQRVHMPFAIVSVDPSNPSGAVKNGDEQAAVQYLKGILTKGKFLGCSEIEEIAIRALQLLYDDIWVTVAYLGEEESLSSNLIKRRLRIIEKGEEDKLEDGWMDRIMARHGPKPV